MLKLQNEVKTDILVIGSGIAGLSFALKAAQLYPERKIFVVSKGSPEDTNSRFAQGGIAGVYNSSDSKSSHAKDTIDAGDYLNTKSAVHVLVDEAPQRIKELIELGVSFDKDQEGNYHLALEGGHSSHRIFHYKDATGWEILRVLINTCYKFENIQFFSNGIVTDLIPGQNLRECTGALIFSKSTHSLNKILSKVTILATGGAGQVYLNTTNPEAACGDGIAMAGRLAAKIENMEFVQFHPTALFNPEESPSFLISEAVRGEGAVLKNHKNEDFVKKYDERGSLAPRDIVARAIFSEMELEGNEHVFLDCTSIPLNRFKEHFPTIYKKCLSEGINVEKDFIPVSPAAHYTCGGIKTDLYGKTSVKRLYAIGECSSTGVHGANRLASNSLSEALVFGTRAAVSCAFELSITPGPTTNVDYNYLERGQKSYSDLKYSVKRIMWEKAGIVKSTDNLKDALEHLSLVYNLLVREPGLSSEYFETRSLVEVALLIVKASLKRKENRGGFFNKDLKELVKLE